MKWLLLLFILVLSQGKIIHAQNYYTLQGIIKSSEGSPLPGASIRIKNENIGTAADKNGKFNLKLEEGYYTLVVSLLGFQTRNVDLTLKFNQDRIIILDEVTQELDKVTVSNRKKDRGKEIMSEVISRRGRFRSQIQTSVSKVYIKATEETEQTIRLSLKKNTRKKDTISIHDSILAFHKELKKIDSMASEKKRDTTFISDDLNIYEVILSRWYKKPQQIKELKEAVRKAGDKDGLFYLSTQEGDFDLYQSTIYIPGLSVNTFLSPLSPLAFSVYSFELKGMYYDKKEAYYIISVKPKALGNALVFGELHIAKNDFTLHRADIQFMPEKLNEYDQFRVLFEYDEFDTCQIIRHLEFLYQSNTKKSKVFGRTVVHYQYQSINQNLPKNTFGDEVSTTLDSAFQRDSVYWAKIRPELLTPKEAKVFQTQDSIREAHSKKSYLDSMDREFNKITFLNILWYGQGHVNRERKELWNFAPLVALFNPVQIGGFRMNLWCAYSKTFPKRRSIYLWPNLNYGFRNRDIKGNLSFTWLYNTFKRATLNVTTGRNFELIYGNEAYINMFRRSNFYEEDQIGVNHDIELVNGLYLEADIDFAKRKSIVNYKFGNSGTKIFGNAIPVAFDPYNALTTEVSLRYTPRQLYARERYEKIILGSRWPTFVLRWRQGIPNVLGSVLKFTYWEAGIRQKINFGLFGQSEYRLLAGRFEDSTSLQLMDYKIHRQADPYILRNPLYNYQLLPKTLITYKFFVEAHYYHRFNGYFTQRIPGFKKLNINEVAGYSWLWAKDFNFAYSEIFFGAERVFKIIRDRFRFGVYYVMAVSNQTAPLQGFRFSIEFYDRARNRFNF